MWLTPCSGVLAHLAGGCGVMKSAASLQRQRIPSCRRVWGDDSGVWNIGPWDMEWDVVDGHRKGAYEQINPYPRTLPDRC